MGNYKGFGDCKFVPNLLEDRMEKLVLASQAAANNPELKELWNKVSRGIYYYTKFFGTYWERGRKGGYVTNHYSA